MASKEHCEINISKETVTVIVTNNMSSCVKNPEKHDY